MSFKDAFHENRMAGSMFCAHLTLWQMKYLVISISIVWDEFEQITSADLHRVKHWLWPENNSYVAFFKWKQAVSHLWLMNSPFQLASVIHRMKIFQETWRLLFLFYHFPLNVLCDRCVLFSTLDCWAYVMFFIFSFMKHLLQRNIFISKIEFSLTHLVKITIIASLFLIE